MKYCAYCGKKLYDAAVMCPACGRSTTAPRVIDEELLEQFCQRVTVNGVIWFIIGIVQFLVGFVAQWWFIMGVGLLNFITGAKDVSASARYRDDPNGIVDAVSPLVGPMLVMLYNLLIGGVIGVVGSIYYLIAIRDFVLKHETEFLRMDSER